MLAMWRQGSFADDTFSTSAPWMRTRLVLASSPLCERFIISIGLRLLREVQLGTLRFERATSGILALAKRGLLSLERFNLFGTIGLSLFQLSLSVFQIGSAGSGFRLTDG